jgi:hypothetical protein
MQGKYALSQQLVMPQLVMNSSQRRKNKRKFLYSIQLVCSPHEKYFVHDNRVADAHVWCKNKFKDKFNMETYWSQAEFKFATEKDAVIFALKWL